MVLVTGLDINRLCLNLSTYGGALADPEYLRMVAPQFVLRKKVANLCVRLRASEAEQMNPLLQTVGLCCCCCLGHYFGISVSGKGGIRLRRRNPYYLNQMGHSVCPS